MSDDREPFTVLPFELNSPRPIPLCFRSSAIAAVALGGLIGAPARYGLGVLFPHSPPGHWPVTTFAINNIGAFVLGALLEALARLGPDSGWRRRARLGVGTGLIGSFTTYSTLAVDTDLLLRGHHPWAAITYALATVIAGMVATAVGIGAGAWLTSRHREDRR